MKLASAVWTREAGTEIDTLGRRAYIGMITFWTTVGLALTAMGSAISYDWQMTWTLLLAVLGVSLVGVFLNHKERHPVTNFFGLALVAFPFGLMLGPVFAMYTAASIAKVLGLTVFMTVVLGLLGMTIPGSLQHWAGWLCGALLLLIAGLIITPLLGAVGVPVGGMMTIIDWAGVLLFSALIVFDMNRALRLRRTHAAALEVALAMYLDIINLMMYLLRIFGVQANND